MLFQTLKICIVRSSSCTVHHSMAKLIECHLTQRNVGVDPQMV